MNRIESKMNSLKENKEKAFITYMTAGLPDMEGCADLIRAQETAGVDLIELGVPFSDPAADGPVIQTASYQSILKGTNLNKVFDMVRGLRESGVEIPIVLMLYYNTAFHYGLEKFVDACKRAGVDGMTIPDLPLEEQGELKQYLNDGDAPILIQFVSPISGDRIPELLKDAKGFVYCVSTMGVTGRQGSFHQQLRSYLGKVKKHTDVPIMMGFGIRTPEDVLPLKDILDGAIVGTYFVRLLDETDYNKERAAEYCEDFRRKWNTA